MIMEIISLLGVLGALSIEDIKNKRIPVALLAISGIVGIIMHLIYARLTIWNILGGISIGVVMYLISVLSDEAIGKGDAMLIAVTGIYLGFWGNIILLWVSAVIAGIGGLAVFLIKHRDRHYEMPFIPFMLVGYVACLIAWEGRLL